MARAERRRFDQGPQASFAFLKEIVVDPIDAIHALFTHAESSVAQKGREFASVDKANADALKRTCVLARFSGVV